MNFSHPLLETFDLEHEDKLFSKIFTGQEFYLADHCIKDVPTLPGAAYIELAHIAGSLVLPEQQVSTLKNIIWSSPFQIHDKAQELTIKISSGNTGTKFEVTTTSNPSDKPKICARGKFNSEQKEIGMTDSSLDFSSFKNHLNRKLDPNEIYNRFYELGLQYGSSFQTIKELTLNHTEAISSLQLPEHLEKNFEKFIMHPSILDGAIQTAFTLLIEESENLYLPFSIGKISVFKALPKLCKVYSVIEPGSQAAGSPKFQITMTDELGNIVLNIFNMTARALPKI